MSPAALSSARGGAARLSPQAYVVDQRERLGAADFTRLYVDQRRPVLMKNALAGCSALSRWTLDYLRDQAGDKEVSLKRLDEAGIKVTRQRFADYAQELARDAQRNAGERTNAAPAYLHDVPLTSLLPDAPSDLETFPVDYFPRWYRGMWWRFAQLFVGPRDSLTPLHFDCLLTHNLFFQIAGRKRFILIPPEQLAACYPRDWRWSAVNAEQPDYERFPNFRNAAPVEALVEPGDILYMPPGALHHVRSLDSALSFNIDWHTRDSAMRGVAAATRGMPLQNVYYNAVIAAGLWSRLPAERLFPYYASYLNYVS